MRRGSDDRPLDELDATMTIGLTAHRKSICAGLVTAVLAAIALWLVLNHSSDASASAPPSPQASGRGQWAAGTYGVFNRPARRDDDLSSWRARDDHGLGLRLSEGRVVFRDGSRAVAAVPATDGPCLVTQFADGSGGVVCGGADHPTVSTGYVGAIGIVPDSVGSVTFTLADGSTVAGAVDENTWRSPDDALRVSYSVAGREQQAELMARSAAPSAPTRKTKADPRR
jgi:hypothetical protein